MNGSPVVVLYLPLICALIGVLLYVLSEKAKPCEIGRIMFWTGLLAFLLSRH